MINIIIVPKRKLLHKGVRYALLGENNIVGCVSLIFLFVLCLHISP